MSNLTYDVTFAPKRQKKKLFSLLSRTFVKNFGHAMSNFDARQRFWPKNTVFLYAINSHIRPKYPVWTLLDAFLGKTFSKKSINSITRKNIFVKSCLVLTYGMI